MAVLVYEWRSLSEESQAEVLALRDHYEGLWLSVLEQLRAEGSIDAEPFIVRRMLTGALSWTVTWYRPERGGLTLDGLTDQVLRSEEHTSELQSRPHLVCRLLLEKKNKKTKLA